MGISGGASGGIWALYIPPIPIYIPKTTPTVPEFKAFKGFADISQSFGALFKVPSGPPRGQKMGKSANPGIGKMPKMGKIAPRAAPQDPTDRKTDPRKNG